MSKYLSLPVLHIPGLPASAVLTAIFCACCANAPAQEDVAARNITSHLAESLPAEEDLSQLTERLSFYRRNPIDLNHTTAEQLKELVFLSALQINNLFTHIRMNGKIKDILELQAVDDFDPETITRLSPFVTLKTASDNQRLWNFKNIKNKGKTEVLWRFGQVLKKQKGFLDLPGSRYLGGPQKLLLKYKYSLADRAAFSFTADKDAGERLFSNQTKSGFDFLSGSLALYKNGRFKKIILGDYSLQFGQGLTLWTGTSFGKGADVAGVAKKDTGLKPYTSTDEYAFFRGIGTTLIVLKNIDLTTFISYRSLDASFNKESDGKYTLSTISSSGLHRTATEIRNKGSLKQLVYGTVLQLKTSNLEAGITAYHSAYDHEFTRGSLRYRRYSFEGKSLGNLGLHYNFNFKNIYFFGETAKSIPGGMAVLSGAMTSLSSRVSAVVLLRDYAKDHITFYSQGLAAGSAAANEKGLYGGIHFSTGTKWDGALYADLFHFPWAKYRIDSASSGYDLMGQLSCSPQKSFKLTVKISLGLSGQNLSAGMPVNPLVKVRKEHYRLGAGWRLNPKIKMENRAEITAYRKGNIPRTYGYMVYQDADYSPLSSRFAANMRLAFFNTPTYENRIYAYEDDVLYGAGSGLYNGRGIRTFLNISYRLSGRLRAWARHAVSWYPEKEKTGSGLDEINGNTKPEIKLQLRYQF
ncbi:ComEA family DNA-binding protein [Pedobacter hartonius]|uniref:Helix-hairpin-helix motif-containing protein n=1 Tax=Pedobacter hartonius TaxID=425514 RepID=A0A1H4D5C4_9SPHI|nr:helix-hairpin-helix domain-containing protein [Pedobacter hartonius]SEA68033.1 Helix-hairpin-helix motif-containing protein [Pedobacter hartonius]